MHEQWRCMINQRSKLNINQTYIVKHQSKAHSDTWAKIARKEIAFQYFDKKYVDASILLTHLGVRNNVMANKTRIHNSKANMAAYKIYRPDRKARNTEG